MLKALILLALLAIPAASVQIPPRGNASPDTVFVSRRALTIAFWFDSSAVAKAREPSATLNVELILAIEQLSSWIRLNVALPASGLTFHPVACRALTDTYSCRDSAAVEIAKGRMTITIRDSAALALMFVNHPAKVWLHAPGSHFEPPVLRYVDPQILAPSKEALAEYDRALGRDHWGPWDRMMWTSSFGALDTAWMQVGERMSAALGEMQCRPIDSCNSRTDFSATGWTSSDSSVVALEAPSNEPRRVSITLVGLRPGRSIVTAQGLHGPSDDLPRSTRVHSLSRHIVVINRLARVQIAPRPATIIAGSKFEIVAQAVDETGGIVADAPIQFYVIYDSPVQYGGWDGKRYDLATRADLTTPGHRRFIARFDKFADTLDVQIIPR
jgi:hypothetical protein